MTWLVYALGAISAAATSDIFRKLGSNLKDPFLSNLIFQAGSFATAILLYLLFSRNLEGNSRGIAYAIAGGVLISVFTTFTFKALSLGQVSTVIPVIRVGGVILVTILGVLLLKEKLTTQLFFGILLASAGIYLIFSQK